MWSQMSNYDIIKLSVFHFIIFLFYFFPGMYYNICLYQISSSSSSPFVSILNKKFANHVYENLELKCLIVITIIG